MPRKRKAVMPDAVLGMAMIIAAGEMKRIRRLQRAGVPIEDTDFDRCMRAGELARKAEADRWQTWSPESLLRMSDTELEARHAEAQAELQKTDGAN